MSIVTPSFNQGQYLEETIRSVLLQGYPNLEYLVMDGGSTDDSLTVIRRYEPWLADWVSRPDAGQSQAINQGFARANGDVLGWLNSDDIYLPGALQKIGAILSANADVPLVYGQALYMDQESVLAGQVLALPFNFKTLLTESNFIPQPSAFFRHAAFVAAGGLNEELHFVMDYDLWLRFRPLGRALFVPQALSGMRTYPQSKTGSAARRMFVELRQVIEQNGGQGLPSGFQRWLLKTRVPMAFAAFRQGNLEAGRDELRFIIQYVPAWQASPEPIIHEIVQQSWRQAPGLSDDDQAILTFADVVCSHLPDEITAPNWVRRQTLARLHERLSYRSYQRGDQAASRRYVWQVLRDDPRSVKQRGLWGTVLRSWIQSVAKPSRGSHRPTGWVRRRHVLDVLQLSAPDTATKPALLNTCTLAASVGLLNAWDVTDPILKAAWTAQLQAAQDPVSGVFSEPDSEGGHVDRPLAAPAYDQWLTTYLALGGLDGLGVPPGQALLFTEDLKSPVAALRWLANLDWSAPNTLMSLDWSQPWLSNGALVMFLTSFLIREGQRTGEPACQAAAHAVLNWLDDRQDPESGFWRLSRGKQLATHTVYAGHFTPLYFCLGRPVQHVERLIDSVVSLQESNGLFSPAGAPSACAAQTAIDLLVKLSLLTDYRAATIKLALTHAFRRLSGELKTPTTHIHAGQPSRQSADPTQAPASHWLATQCLPAFWLRLSALGLISQRYPDEFLSDVPWQFPPPPALGWHQPELLQNAGAAS